MFYTQVRSVSILVDDNFDRISFLIEGLLKLIKFDRLVMFDDQLPFAGVHFRLGDARRVFTDPFHNHSAGGAVEVLNVKSRLHG